MEKEGYKNVTARSGSWAKGDEGGTEVINSFYGRETVPLNDAVIVGHGTTVSRKFIHANSDTSRRNTRVG